MITIADFEIDALALDITEKVLFIQLVEVLLERGCEIEYIQQVKTDSEYPWAVCHVLIGTDKVQFCGRGTSSELKNQDYDCVVSYFIDDSPAISTANAYFTYTLETSVSKIHWFFNKVNRKKATLVESTFTS